MTITYEAACPTCHEPVPWTASETTEIGSATVEFSAEPDCPRCLEAA